VYLFEYMERTNKYLGYIEVEAGGKSGTVLYCLPPEVLTERPTTTMTVMQWRVVLNVFNGHIPGKAAPKPKPMPVKQMAMAWGAIDAINETIGMAA